MSLLDTASLIVTPNGYKEGKLYSVIPSDGSGDMSVTRATTATRVNSAGLVELVPYNLLQYSQEFDNAWWSKYQATITANATIAPDGTTSAESITNNLSAVASVYKTGITNFGTNTISCYFKKGTYNYVFLELGGNSYNFCSFNIATGTVEVISGFSNVTIEDAGNGWYRCYATASDSASTITAGFGTAGSPTAGDVTYIWGAQLVEGSVAKDYQKTETRLNIPRLDYSNGTCPSLLVEPQRTNLLRYSSSIDDNSSWAKIEGNGGSAPIVTANYGISPDGTQNADRIQLTRTTDANSFSYIYQTVSGLSSGQYTWSVWLKSLSGTPSVALSFDGTNYTNIVTLSNEWERYEFTTTAAGNLQATFILFQALPSTSLTADFLAYGFQLEAGSYASSYIPTTSASVTRNADVISKTGISSLIGQTEGTLFWEGQGNTQSTGDDLWILEASANDTSTAVLLYYVHSSGYINCYINNGSSYVNLGAPMTITDNNKVAVGYKSGDFVMYVNGTQIDSNTSATAIPSGMNQVAFNKWLGFTGQQKQLTKAAALWKTRLTNAQLAQLTTI